MPIPLTRTRFRRPLVLPSLLLLWLLPAIGSTQPARIWERALRGELSETAVAAVAVPGGGLIMAGEANDVLPWQLEIHLSRLAPNGDSLWANTYQAEQTQHSYAIARHPAGVVVAGSHSYQWGNNYYTDPLLSAFDWNGEPLWQRSFGGYNLSGTRALCRMPDGGYALGGFTGPAGQPVSQRDVHVIRTTVTGEMIWQRTFDFGDRDEAHAILPLADGGLVVLAQIVESPPVDYQVAVLRLAPNGDELARFSYGSDESEFAYDLHRLDDGSLLIAGEAYHPTDPGRLTDGFLHHVSPAGQVLSDHRYGGAGYDGFRDLLALEDGGYLLGGHATSYGTDEEDDDLYVVRTDETGQQLWGATWGGDRQDKGYALLRLDLPGDPQYVIAGASRSYSQSPRYDPYAVRFADRPPYASITLEAGEQPIVLPDSGGSFNATVQIAELSGEERTWQAWVSVFTPATSLVQPLNMHWLTLPAAGSVDADLVQPVPAFAPPGEYLYIGNLGRFPWITVARDTLRLTVEQPDSGETLSPAAVRPSRWPPASVRTAR